MGINHMGKINNFIKILKSLIGELVNEDGVYVSVINLSV